MKKMVCDLWQNIMLINKYRRRLNDNRIDEKFAQQMNEKITIEYKTCQHGIQADVYETVCSFSNRYGGYIIMGVEDDGTPIGINRNMSKDMRKNFVNQLNNPDRMSPTLYLSIEEFEYEGKLLLWVYVHQHQLSKNVLIEYMTEMKMGTWILQIHLFNYKICITEKATHM